MKEFFKRLLRKQVSAEQYIHNPKLRKELLQDPDVKGYINPLWEIEVVHNGKSLIKMPFCFLIHTHLKDYGFDPDSKMSNTPIIVFRTSGKGEARIPLFVKKLWG